MIWLAFGERLNVPKAKSSVLPVTRPTPQKILWTLTQQFFFQIKSEKNYDDICTIGIILHIPIAFHDT